MPSLAVSFGQTQGDSFFGMSISQAKIVVRIRSKARSDGEYSQSLYAT